MPIYEYKCTDCQHELEKLQKISEPRLTDCPECGKPALRKMISAVGFRLKGSGWYETDFKNSGQKKASDSGSDSGKADSSGSTSSKTDSAKSGGSKSDSTGSASSKKAAAS